MYGLKETKPKKPRKAKEVSKDSSDRAINSAWKDRFQKAHEAHFAENYPVAYASEQYFKPIFPPVHTSNGLTNAICKYMEWTGGIGNRISVSGRLVEQDVNIGGGRTMAVKKFITSSTIKGSADITVQFANGKIAFVEIKVGSDKPREAQLKMQARVRKANGIYEFIHSMVEFYELYDRIMFGELFV